MLITLNEIYQKYPLHVKGLLHIGAHECEELSAYMKKGISPDRIYWIDALQDKVNKMRNMGIPNVYNAVIDEENDKEIVFKVTNNGQSSSILDFGSHSTHHPHVRVTNTFKEKTIRLDTFIEKNHIPIQNINMLNLDIQGVELRALRSMEKYLKHIDYIYTEVNTEFVYKDCGLLPEIDEYLKLHGFTRKCVRMAGNYGWGDAFYMRD